jgi:hypothetical protein
VLNELSTLPWRPIREWIYSSTIIELVTRWRWAVGFTPRQLFPREKSSRYALDRRLGGPQSPSGRCGEERNLLHLPEIEPVPSSL